MHALRDLQITILILTELINNKSSKLSCSVLSMQSQLYTFFSRYVEVGFTRS